MFFLIFNLYAIMRGALFGLKPSLGMCSALMDAH